MRYLILFAFSVVLMSGCADVSPNNSAKDSNLAATNTSVQASETTRHFTNPTRDRDELSLVEKYLVRAENCVAIDRMDWVDHHKSISMQWHKTCLYPMIAVVGVQQISGKLKCTTPLIDMPHYQNKLTLPAKQAVIKNGSLIWYINGCRIYRYNGVDDPAHERQNAACKVFIQHLSDYVCQ